MRVKVTAKDVRDGVRGSPRSCPIALAVQRTTPDYSCRVSLAGVTFFLIDELYITAQVLLPPKAREFIGAFDEGKPVKPFEFEL